MQQEQFLEVIDRDEAERRFHAVLDLRPLHSQEVPLADAWQRVLARDIVAPVDVPSFDRSNVDGFAVRAQDTFGASDDQPRRLRLTGETLATGMIPAKIVGPGQATPIVTGAVVPRGSDAVVMIEYTDASGAEVVLRRPVTPAANITFAGTDIGRGETVLRRGELLTARETGVAAALGLERLPVVRRPRVAVVSTGDEVVAPGTPMRPGLVYDSNAVILADAVRELGAEPVPFGIVADDEKALLDVLRRALECDVILLSGGTSKGPGDLSYRVLSELGQPGIVAHGVALKPGKPLCLAAVRLPTEERGEGRGARDERQGASGEIGEEREERREASSASPLAPVRTVPIAVLPGFPTSAIFTFREFLAPVIRRLAGRRDDPSTIMRARLPMRVNSERGRTEYLLVGLVSRERKRPDEAHTRKLADNRIACAPGYEDSSLIAFPMGKGSGSVTTFSRADGFVVIPRQREYLEAGDIVDVHILGLGLQPADLVVIGSHCVGLDYLLGRLHDTGFRSKFLAVGSMGGLTAARRGECDIAGIHLLDPATNTYNRPFAGRDLLFVRGYGRRQGILFRPGDRRFEGRSLAEAVAAALADPDSVLVNRNRGSGTRVLIDRLLGDAQPTGFLTEARSHNAVAAAIAQRRADWGVAIDTVARDSGLGFLALQDEQYDFVIPPDRAERAAVRAFCELLEQPATRNALQSLGFRPSI